MAAKKPVDDDTTAMVSADASYTSPLGLLARLRPPAVELDFVPVLDLCVIALLFSLLFTRFVITPGVRVDLPGTDLEMRHTPRPVAVLTIQNEGMLFFDGAVYELSSIDRGFDSYLLRTGQIDPVLLVKAEADLSLQLFLELCEMAKNAGFEQVQVSGENPVDEGDGFPVRGPSGPEGADTIPVF